MKVFLTPTYRQEDKADGGIRRVVEAQRKWLPSLGIDLVDSIEAADVVATHAVDHPRVPVGKPWITHCHGLLYADFGWEGSWYQQANKQLVEIMRAADHVTAPSEWVAQTLRRGMWLNPTVLYHGVDPEEWEPGEDDGYVLFNKARLDAASDPRPVNALALRDPSLRFVSTFGDDMPNVTVTGALPYPEMQALVRNAGVYLSTSRETFGIGTLEAMAAGIPVVGWAWGGNREIVQHGVTGWLARPGDLDGLLEGIRWAQAHRREIGEAARADVLERWTWERAIARYADLYRHLYAREAMRAETGTPKVSVIVPCYNLGRFLGDTLRSVQAQTMTDWECIVVDDASTDDSAAVAAGFVKSDPRFSYLKNERNLHVSATRNRGMAQARGRYLLPLDADDMITPETLALLSQALDKDRGIHLAYGGLQIMSEAGVLREGAHDWPPPFDFKEQIQGRNQVPTLCMFRREVWERTGGYRRRLSPVEDADLWTRAASIGFVPRKVTDAATLLYRLRADSISRTMPNPEWAPWYPWSVRRALVPFGAAVEPPAGQIAWPVPTYEPVRVAVIIPVGPGHEGLLVDALDSVAAQTYQQWECIVVNDTGNGPLPWVPSWAKVITTAGRIGPAAARNLGIAASKAALFVPLDADDYLQPDALMVLLAAYEQAGGGVIYSQWWDDFGKATTLPAKVYDPPEYDAKLLTARGCIHAVTALYPRSAWEQVGGFDEALTHWEDWDFALKLASVGVCGTKVAQPLWTYRKQTGARREQNASAFDAGKQAILAKWGPLWEGKDELMACRSCPGGGGGRITPAAQPPQSQSQPQGGGSNGGDMMMPMGMAEGGGDGGAAGAVLLEYLDPSPSVRTFRGQKTGQSYRFGNTDGAKVKYVHAADATALLGMKFFRRAAMPAVALVASSAQQEGVTVPAVTGLHLTANTLEPEPVLPPMPQAQAIATVQEVAAKLEGRGSPEGAQTYQQLRAQLPDMTAAEKQAALDEEVRGQNRRAVVRMLETAIAAAGAQPEPAHA